MTVENQSSIRFSVEESIWFQRGQEVSELLSMSLDPDIVIQEHDQYISVKGGLVLTGEYHAQTEDDGREVNRPETARNVHEVTTREDGVSELRHKFPVDITIPKNRIQNLNDVYVTIEAFDYELPQRGNLLLEADLSITGIYGDEKQQAAFEEEREEESREEEDVEVDETIEEVQSTQEEPPGDDEDVVEEVTAEDAHHDLQEDLQENIEEELVAPLMRGSYSEESEEPVTNEDPFTPFVVEAKSEHPEEEVEVSEEKTDEVEETVAYVRTAPQLEFKSRVEQPEASNPAESNDSGSNDENTLYLTKLFADENTSETAKLRMCIVQKDETLEMIAERYDVQAQSLIRINHLDREHLAEGQILYIPALVGNRK
ncbi:stage VI sporulation protein D [Bacillus salitolerans]|uniref:Stage VI sporulation protein D n=1 Tax=Bacillus salitolerans TaxID=1437434 RepID=A0ABW4LM85_9BACI